MSRLSLTLLAVALGGLAAAPADACGRCGGRCGGMGMANYGVGFRGPMFAPTGYTTMRPGLFGWRQRTFIPYSAGYTPMAAPMYTAPVSLGAPTVAGYGAASACGCAPASCDPCGCGTTTNFAPTTTAPILPSSCPSGLCGANYAPADGSVIGGTSGTIIDVTEPYIPGTYQEFPGTITNDIPSGSQPTPASDDPVRDQLERDRDNQFYNPGVREPQPTFEDDVDEGGFRSRDRNARDQGDALDRMERMDRLDREPAGNGFGSGSFGEDSLPGLDEPAQPLGDERFDQPDARDMREQTPPNRRDRGLIDPLDFEDDGTETFNKIPLKDRDARKPITPELDDSDLLDDADGVIDPEVWRRHSRLVMTPLPESVFEQQGRGFGRVRSRTQLPPRYRLPRTLARGIRYETPRATQLAAN